MKAKILLIGYGYWGKIWYKTIQNSMYELVAVVDPMFENKVLISNTSNAYSKLENVKEEYTHVIVSTPAETHLEIYNKLKELNIPDERILIEKPVGLNSKEAHIMSNCCHDLVWLYDSMYIDLLKYIKEIGKINLIQTFRASMGPRLRTDVSIVEDYLFHDIYLYLNLFNSKVDYINFDFYSVNKTHFRNHDSLIKQDTVSINVFDSLAGVNLQMFSSWVYPHKCRRWVIVGDNGSIIWENDSIFINKTRFEKKEDTFFINNNGNIGYELINDSEKMIKESEYTIKKSNLTKLLNTFISNEFDKIEKDLVIETHKFINTILNKEEE